MSRIKFSSGDPERSSRIEEVVAQDISRSKRLLWFYSLLLVIPLGACVAYYYYGRTDVAMVHSEVNNNLAPIKQIVDEARPALVQVRQTAEQISGQQARIDVLSQQQQALAATVQAVPEQLQQIDTVRSDLSAVKANVQMVQAQSQDLRSSVQNASAGVDDLNKRFSSVQERQSQIELNLRALSTRIEQTPQTNPDGQLQQQQKIINDLQRRLNTLEKQRVNPLTQRPQ